MRTGNSFERAEDFQRCALAGFAYFNSYTWRLCLNVKGWVINFSQNPRDLNEVDAVSC